jgi:hypothetical protein
MGNLMLAGCVGLDESASGDAQNDQLQALGRHDGRRYFNLLFDKNFLITCDWRPSSPSRRS